jgi:small-conductance mechanosensitive channel
MLDLLRELASSPPLRHAVASAGLLLALIVARTLAVRALRRTDLVPEVRRRWMVQMRTAAVVIFLLGLAVIWADEVRAVALSFVAIAAALVLATRELFLCFSGALLRGTARAFSVGDRIEVDGSRGDVIDFGALSTTVLEVGPGPIHQRTGRAIVIPNSIFLSKPIVNESLTDDYVLHVLTVPVTESDEWPRSEKALLEAASSECAPFLEDARAHMSRVGAEQGLEPLNVDPRVSIRLPEPGLIHLLLRFPSPVRLRGRLEQAILRRYLESVGSGTPASKGLAVPERSSAQENEVGVLKSG